MNAKSLVACAALLMGVAFVAPQASAAGVQSDIVGYTTMKAQAAGFDLIALPLSNLNANTKELAITEITGDLSSGRRESQCDKLFVMDPATKQYKVYIYKTVSGEKFWAAEGESVPTTDTIKLGMGAFLDRVSAEGSVVIAGKVEMAETTDVATQPGLSILANPYPTAVKVADIVGDIATGRRESQCDKIMVLDAATKVYTTYVFKKDGWVKNGEASVTTDTIPANASFFFDRTADTTGKLQFKRTY